MKLQVFPIQYKGATRIGINPLGFDRAFPSMMKQIRVIFGRLTWGVGIFHIAKKLTLSLSAFLGSSRSFRLKKGRLKRVEGLKEKL